MKKIYLPGYSLSFFFLFFFSLLFCAAAYSQALRPADKIDPVFTYIIDHKSNITDAAIYEHMPSPAKIKPTDGYVTPGGPVEKRYDCIVYTVNAQVLKDSGIIVRSVLPAFVTAWVTIEQLVQMSLMPGVSFIQAPEINGLHNDIAVGTSGASLLHQARLNNTAYKGKNVLVAIFDTGIDWDHPDFRDPADQTKSRILRIWDQVNTVSGGGHAPPAGFGYGTEYTQTQINDELDGTPAGFVLENDINGHGTHVAGTAAGNGMALTSRKYTGMAPEADIIVIKGGNGSFSSANIIDALTYLQTLATSLGKPIVLNMSLGGQSGPHDGTQAQEIAVNNFTASAAGRVVVISAGNDNGTNIHNQLSIAPASAGVTSIAVPGASTGTDVFQYSAYANNANTVTASVTTPLGAVVSTPGATPVAVTGGTCTVNLTNTIDAGSGVRFVNVYITRTSGNPTGTWSISITNTGAGTITVHGWLNYISSGYASTTLAGGNSAYLVGSPGNATSAITAAAYMPKYRWYSTSTSAPGGYNYSGGKNDSICTFSSHGPRRDGVQKPDIAADGQAVVSCLSSDAGVAATSVFITNQGLYQVEQGTSMSSPVIAGAVALLLQAKPSATATEIKSLLTSTAHTDVWTAAEGAAPNTTWGYGKLDVFKAASSLFNCTSPAREMYQYDNNVGQASATATLVHSNTQRVGLRFQPTLTGKLGGVFFHTGTFVLNTTVEVRLDNAGVPGALYAAGSVVNITAASDGLSRFSWNYIDLSSLNVNVVSGTNYFIVVYSTAGTWSILAENQSVAGRSSLSGNSGSTWSVSSFDYLIRPVVYSNSQSSSGLLANINTSDTRDINTSNQFFSSSDCRLIAQLVAAGASPVTGNVATDIWLEASVPHVGGRPFVSRHYQLMPSVNAAAATGSITLYFTQAEFTAFNADPGSTFDLPANPTDVAGIANLRIGKFPGTSSNGSGMPWTYSGGTPTVIDPVDTDIIWNAEYSRWEVSFNTVGFSGFIVQTDLIALPVTVAYFTGKKQAAANLLNWKVYCTASSTQFDVQRSSTGNSNDFTGIGILSSAIQDCSQPFLFTDASPLPGKNYYRIKITENTGRVSYTGIVLLQSGALIVNTVTPTIVNRNGNLQVSYLTGAKGYFVITDMAGRQVYDHALVNGSQSLSLLLPSAGIYFYSIKNDKAAIAGSGKLVVQ